MTGAMTPLGFEGSDGLQDLTEGLFAIRFLKPGIYIVMHGHYVAIENMWRQPEDFVFPLGLAELPLHN
jgi:hypothetical protein